MWHVQNRVSKMYQVALMVTFEILHLKRGKLHVTNWIWLVMPHVDPQNIPPYVFVSAFLLYLKVDKNSPWFYQKSSLGARSYHTQWLYLLVQINKTIGNIICCVWFLFLCLVTHYCCHITLLYYLQQSYYWEGYNLLLQYGHHLTHIIKQYHQYIR